MDIHKGQPDTETGIALLPPIYYMDRNPGNKRKHLLPSLNSLLSLGESRSFLTMKHHYALGLIFETHLREVFIPKMRESAPETLIQLPAQYLSTTSYFLESPAPLLIIRSEQHRVNLLQ
ncbi:uncharacterized protein LOC143782791 [Ranitomeya variabilis]|uniref:uncharacterized protein LOC143782791 n=1 Tax=Ranitomeya variabilis TaxID=490064 RepID=UPI004056B590